MPETARNDDRGNINPETYLENYGFALAPVVRRRFY